MLVELEPRVHELERNRAVFTTFLATFDDARWNAPVGAEGYSPRQTLAHLAGACKSMARMAQHWIAGKENTLRPDFDLNYFNARQQDKRANLSKAELLQEWTDAQRDLTVIMETVRADDLDKRGQHPTAGSISVRELFQVITSHEADHIRQVTSVCAE